MRESARNRKNNKIHTVQIGQGVREKKGEKEEGRKAPAETLGVDEYQGGHVLKSTKDINDPRPVVGEGGGELQALTDQSCL